MGLNDPVLSSRVLQITAVTEQSNQIWLSFEISTLSPSSFFGVLSRESHSCSSEDLSENKLLSFVNLFFYTVATLLVSSEGIKGDLVTKTEDANGQKSTSFL